MGEKGCLDVGLKLFVGWFYLVVYVCCVCSLGCVWRGWNVDLVLVWKDYGGFWFCFLGGIWSCLFYGVESVLGEWGIGKVYLWNWGGFEVWDRLNWVWIKSYFWLNFWVKM